MEILDTLKLWLSALINFVDLTIFLLLVNDKLDSAQNQIISGEPQ